MAFSPKVHFEIVYFLCCCKVTFTYLRVEGINATLKSYGSWLHWKRGEGGRGRDIKAFPRIILSNVFSGGLNWFVDGHVDLIALPAQISETCQNLSSSDYQMHFLGFLRC